MTVCALCYETEMCLHVVAYGKPRQLVQVESSDMCEDGMGAPGDCFHGGTAELWRSESSTAVHRSSSTASCPWRRSFLGKSYPTAIPPHNTLVPTQEILTLLTVLAILHILVAARSVSMPHRDELFSGLHPIGRGRVALTNTTLFCQTAAIQLHTQLVLLLAGVCLSLHVYPLCEATSS